MLLLISQGKERLSELVQGIYPELSPHLEPMAQGQILSHLYKLQSDGKVVMQQEGATLNRYSFIYGSSPVAGSAGPVQLTANEWQHVAIVCDGKEVVIYLNGKETTRGKGENPITPNPSLNFRLGTGFSGGRFFNGALGEADRLDAVYANRLRRIIVERQRQVTVGARNLPAV